MATDNKIVVQETTVVVTPPATPTVTVIDETAAIVKAGSTAEVVIQVTGNEAAQLVLAGVLGPQGPQGNIGVTGPQGPQGIAGATGTTYVHIQNVASTVWTIVHNLNKYPAVSVVDSANERVEGDVDYVDLTTVVVTFSAPFGGSAYLT